MMDDEKPRFPRQDMMSTEALAIPENRIGYRLRVEEPDESLWPAGLGLGLDGMRVDYVRKDNVYPDGATVYQARLYWKEEIRKGLERVYYLTLGEWGEGDWEHVVYQTALVKHGLNTDFVKKYAAERPIGFNEKGEPT